jgi:hypothetical protein
MSAFSLSSEDNRRGVCDAQARGLEKIQPHMHRSSFGRVPMRQGIQPGELLITQFAGFEVNTE